MKQIKLITWNARYWIVFESGKCGKWKRWTILRDRWSKCRRRLIIRFFILALAMFDGEFLIRYRWIGFILHSKLEWFLLPFIFHWTSFVSLSVMNVLCPFTLKFICNIISLLYLYSKCIIMFFFSFAPSMSCKCILIWWQYLSPSLSVYSINCICVSILSLYVCWTAESTFMDEYLFFDMTKIVDKHTHTHLSMYILEN